MLQEHEETIRALRAENEELRTKLAHVDPEAEASAIVKLKTELKTYKNVVKLLRIKIVELKNK